MRICSKCRQSKDLDQFNKKASAKDGLQLKCKNCIKKDNKNYYKKNKAEILSDKKIYYEANKDEILPKCQIYRESSKEKAKIYRESHKEEAKIYRESHKEEATLYQKQYQKERYDIDPQYKLVKNLRSRLNNALRDSLKSGSAIGDLGCSIEELQKHLESQFHPNSITGEIMSWDNHTVKGWHIDHIRPLSSFDLTDREQLKEACHYSNLQPLWAKDNWEKSDKLV